MAYTLLACWGSPGSGKSAISLALAAQLSKRKKDVLVLGMDSRAPALPIYLPKMQTDARSSLGPLLEGSPLTEGSLKDRIHKHPGSDHIFCMGLASGELATLSYRAPERGAVAGLLRLLEDSPFAFVIVDCDANPICDSLTLYALEKAARVVRSVTPDVRGFEWQKAQLAWMGSGEGFHVERHLRAACPVFETSALDAAAALCGGFDTVLPWSYQVMDRLSAGELPIRLDERAGIRFEYGMDTLCTRIMEDT